MSDFSLWYANVVVASDLISYYDISGCYVLRPNAFAIWEIMQQWLDAELKKIGIQNAYFPLFVSEDSLNTEKEHIKGFAAEVAWVTRSGKTKLDPPIAIRPTSESVIYPYFSQWIRSHRDLPLRLNQWNSVVRWEFKHPTPFIRSREFLWQEGHTAFATLSQADLEVRQILSLYERIYRELLAVPVIKGFKSENEKFAGSLFTTSVEGFVPATGRGIQAATSHCLGQNFAKMYHIHFEDDDRSKQLVWQNSWGLSTRSIGLMIMTHGDDKGLVLPPRVAHTQIVIIPIVHKKLSAEESKNLHERAKQFFLDFQARGWRVKLDDRDNYNPGWKYNHWELRGVPIRLELGSRDMANQTVVLVRRDTSVKTPISWSDTSQSVADLLVQIQSDLFTRAKRTFDDSIDVISTWDDFMRSIDAKRLALAPWADEPLIEDDVRKRSSHDEMMGAKTLCIPFDQPELPENTLCFASGKPAKNWALWGRSY